MKTSKNVSFAVTILAFGLIAIGTMLAFLWHTKALAASSPALGAAGSYGILASTYTNTSAGTSVTGDVGFTTPPAVAPAGVHTNYGSGAPYGLAGTDQGAAASALTAEACTFTFAPGAVDLSTDTTHGTAGVYAPGVYCSTGAMDISGPLSLTGSGTYIFRPTGALTSAANATVTLSGASACDVFWTPSQATTLGANNTFAGTILDDAGITIGANTTLTGHALSFGGTVTTDTDTLSVPACAATTGTLHVIKLVVNGNGGTAVASNFNISVKNAGVNVAGSPAAGQSAPGTVYVLPAGTYNLSETANASYVQTFTGDCDTSGNVTLTAGSDRTCTLVNTDIPPQPPLVSSVGGGGHVGIVLPLIGITKVPNPLSLPSGAGPVTYAYTVWNVGKLTALANVTVTDDKCSPVTLLSGDENKNGKLDINEVWKYSCSTTLSKTTTNTAIATGHSVDAFQVPAIATAVATVVVGSPVTPPLIDIVKVPSRLTPFPFGGGLVTYTYTVTNPGVVALHNVTVTDDKCRPVTGPTGDTNHNGLLDTTETWTYTCQSHVAVSTQNIATARGTANGLSAIGYAFATVLVSVPGLPKTGLPGTPVTQWIVIVAALIALGVIATVMTKRSRKHGG